MHISVPPAIAANLYVTLRHLGYAPDRRGESYVRRMRSTSYPRFHLYVNEDARGTVLNLHLDQKQPSYTGSHAHAGEYDGDVVSVEAERIRAML